MSTRVLAKSDKTRNRRSALRIYQQANLFYQKLDATTPALQNKSIPSTSQENDTLNVNISSSGIAFTTREALVTGDTLRLRILLLSSMTTITTNARVVYCRRSNPHELDRYPFTVGAQFVNMTPQETALLETHVERARKRQRILNSGYAALALLVLAAPDSAAHLFIELLHHLLEEALHVSHLLFEYLEMGLDHVIEHQFHTDRHETQVIVFYTIIGSALVLLSFQVRRFSKWLSHRIMNFRQFLLRKKASTLYYWTELSVVEKLKLASLVGLGLVGYVYYLTL